MPHQIDPEFAALPLRSVAEAALTRAQELGVEHADVRIERIRTAHLALHDARLETSHDDDERGLAVRVVHDGTWGFASGLVLDPASAGDLVDQAVEVAKVSKPVTGERIEMAAEPSHGDQTWISAYEMDPLTISESDRIALLADWSSRLLGAPTSCGTSTPASEAVRETKFYADLNGTSTTQQRVRVQCQLSALWVDDSSGRFETMRTNRAAGRTRLGVPHRRLRLGQRARRASGVARRDERRPRRSSQAPTTWSSTRPTSG